MLHRILRAIDYQDRIDFLSMLCRQITDPQFRGEVRRLVWGLKTGCRPIYLKYLPNTIARYGWGRPPHPHLYEVINNNRNEYSAQLENFWEYKEKLSRIPTDVPDDETTPYWRNGWLTGLDPVSLYCYLPMLNSKRYVEIGSGNSTKFARRSISDNQLSTSITSIDPQPRAEIDGLCDTVIRKPLEDTDQGVFSEMEPDDILFVDNSHRCFQNSDVTVFFLEVLLKLRTGVVVHIHDIYLPYDYPPEWSTRYYSEQYLLAILLISDNLRKYDVLLPCTFIGKDELLANKMRLLLAGIGAPGSAGNGIWIRIR